MYVIVTVVFTSQLLVISLLVTLQNVLCLAEGVEKKCRSGGGEGRGTCGSRGDGGQGEAEVPWDRRGCGRLRTVVLFLREHQTSDAALDAWAYGTGFYLKNKYYHLCLEGWQAGRGWVGVLGVGGWTTSVGE